MINLGRVVLAVLTCAACTPAAGHSVTVDGVVLYSTDAAVVRRAAAAMGRQAMVLTASARPLGDTIVCVDGRNTLVVAAPGVDLDEVLALHESFGWDCTKTVDDSPAKD